MFPNLNADGMLQASAIFPDLKLWNHGTCWLVRKGRKKRRKKSRPMGPNPFFSRDFRPTQSNIWTREPPPPFFSFQHAQLTHICSLKLVFGVLVVVLRYSYICVYYQYRVFIYIIFTILSFLRQVTFSGRYILGSPPTPRRGTRRYRLWSLFSYNQGRSRSEWKIMIGAPPLPQSLFVKERVEPYYSY